MRSLVNASKPGVIQPERESLCLTSPGEEVVHMAQFYGLIQGSNEVYTQLFKASNRALHIKNKNIRIP